MSPACSKWFFSLKAFIFFSMLSFSFWRPFLCASSSSFCDSTSPIFFVSSARVAMISDWRLASFFSSWSAASSRLVFLAISTFMSSISRFRLTWSVSPFCSTSFVSSSISSFFFAICSRSFAIFSSASLTRASCSSTFFFRSPASASLLSICSLIREALYFLTFSESSLNFRAWSRSFCISLR